MNTLLKFVLDSFPPPRYIMMPSAGVDISPNSIKVLTGKFTTSGCIPEGFDEVYLSPGTIVGGSIENKKEVVSVLRELKKKHKLHFISASIPEDALYLYTQDVSGAWKRSAIEQQIEFAFSEHVPFPASEAVYDYDVVTFEYGKGVVSVTAAPRKTIESYEAVFKEAGLTPLHMELEAHAIARSVCSGEDVVEMVVDVGHKRAGIIITKNAIPVFSITMDTGSDNAPAVVEACKTHFTFWDTRTDADGKRIERIERVILAGGGASLEIQDALTRHIPVPIEFANVWQHLFSTSEYIPEVEAKASLSFATLSGLLLNNKA